MMTEAQASPRFRRGVTEPAIRPDRLTVWPTEDGYFGVDVRWHGRECILRAVVVRRMLAEAGIEAQPGNSQDGRIWELCSAATGRMPMPILRSI